MPEVSKACHELIRCCCKETVQIVHVLKLVLLVHHSVIVSVTDDKFIVYQDFSFN